jgi:1-phosphatidylinositol phosphodiesterase
MSIANQLDIGVRYLDIRLRQIDNALVVHHGSVYQNQNFDDVLLQVTGFLAANPSETVIMEVSSEYTPANNSESYEQTFLRYVNHASYRSFWWRERTIPTLGAVRGKIVLVRRFSGSAGGAGGIDVTGWQDNTQFTLSDAGGTRIVVQDAYQVSFSSNNTKWNQVTGLLDQAAGDGGATWYVNFTSGVRSILGIPSTLTVSDDINGRLLSFATSSTRHHTHLGTVVSDFVNKQTVQQLLRVYYF